jgi:predicted outer membrane repeat protein
LHIDHSTLADNNARNLGGAIVDEGTSLITRSSLVRNQAFFEGGAIFTDGGNILIINSH